MTGPDDGLVGKGSPGQKGRELGGGSVAVPLQANSSDGEGGRAF